MPEEQIKEPQEIKEAPKEQPQEDLVARVSRLKDEAQAKDELDSKFNVNDLDAAIEKLPDPILKEQVLGLKKSLLKGENQKYEQIANLRKQYETALAQQTSWTPERIKQEMAKPDFVRAAQEIVGQTNNLNEDSMLSEKERQSLEQNTQQINAIMQQNQILLKQQEDERLKQRYANYDPNVVDKAIQDVAAGRVRMTREDIWKAIDYASGINRAYKLREQDIQSENKDKLSGMTIDTTVNMTQPNSVERQKGETTQQFMRRSYQEHSKQKK